MNNLALILPQPIKVIVNNDYVENIIAKGLKEKLGIMIHCHVSEMTSNNVSCDVQLGGYTPGERLSEIHEELLSLIREALPDLGSLSIKIAVTCVAYFETAAIGV